MRLAVLDSGQALGSKLLFALIRAVSRQPTPDILKLLAYRPDFLGSHLKAMTHGAMRGPSPWPVADRELMAAFVSTVNACEFCIRAHTAIASLASADAAKVAAALSNLDTAPIDEPLRATLRLLRKLTMERRIGADDVRAALAAGVSRAQLDDALSVFFVFDATNRLSDAFGFAVPDPKAFAGAAKVLLGRGYR